MPSPPSIQTQPRVWRRLRRGVLFLARLLRGRLFAVLDREDL